MENQKTFWDLVANEPEEERKNRFIKVENGLVINLDEVIDIKDDSYELQLKDGTTKTLKKKVYVIKDKDYAISVPLIVHGKIKQIGKELKAQNQPTNKFKILVEGMGISTKYTVIPWR